MDIHAENRDAGSEPEAAVCAGEAAPGSQACALPTPAQLCELDLLRFGQLMLPQWFTDEPAPFQQQVAGELELALQGGQRLIGALPREHGKTTLGLVTLVLREACRCQLESEQSVEAAAAGAGPSWRAKRHILIIGANQAEARSRLRLIKDELETNQLLKRHFPGIAAPARDQQGRTVAYRSAELVLACGLRIAAYGAGNSLRGSIFRGQRPDLALLDDPETDSSSSSQQRRRKLRAWCERALLPALDSQRGSLVWLGTLLHHDSVLARWLEEWSGSAEPGSGPEPARTAPGGAQAQGATESLAGCRPACSAAAPSAAANPARWRTLFLPALDEAGAPLWPARWSREALAQRAAEIGPAAFAQEYLLRPASAEAQRFRASDFQTYDPAGLELVKGQWRLDGEPLTVVAAMDPAVGLEQQHDYSAVAVLGLVDDSAGRDAPDPAAPPLRAYVLDLQRRRGRFHEQLELLKDTARSWRPRVVGVEKVGYQCVLGEAAQDHGLPIELLAAGAGKALRVERLSTAAARHMLYLPSPSPFSGALRSEALAWPSGQHDDQLDALAYALEAGEALLARERRRGRLSILGVRLDADDDWSEDMARHRQACPRAA